MKLDVTTATVPQLKKRARELKREFWKFIKQIETLEAQLEESPEFQKVSELERIQTRLHRCYSNFSKVMRKIPKNEWYSQDKLKPILKAARHWEEQIEAKLEYYHGKVVEQLQLEFTALTGDDATDFNAGRVSFTYGLVGSHFIYKLVSPNAPVTVKESAIAWHSLVEDIKVNYDPTEYCNKRPLVFDFPQSIYQYASGNVYQETIQDAHEYYDRICDPNFLHFLKEHKEGK